MKKNMLLTVLLLLLPASTAWAMTGGSYLKYCSSAEINSSASLRCGAYVIGVVDTMRSSQAGNVAYKNICFPEKTDEAQMVQMTLKWLHENPESWSSWAAFGVTMAMFENYKCGCDTDKK